VSAEDDQGDPALGWQVAKPMTRKDWLTLATFGFLLASFGARLGWFGDSSTCWYTITVAAVLAILAEAWR